MNINNTDISLGASILALLSPANKHRLNFFKCTPEKVSHPGGSVVKNSSANTGDVSSTPGSGRSPGEGNGNPLQYSCLGNPMDGGAWRATVHGAVKSLT